MEIKNKTQIAIIHKLMFVQKLKYSELHEVTDNHDLFNYHLKELQKKGLILKKDSQYLLSEKGRQFVHHMEEDKTIQAKFKVGLWMDVLREHKGHWQMLLHRRLKHPQYGWIGSVTSKIQYGSPIADNITRELKEEINITPQKFDVLGAVRCFFKDKEDKVVGDGVFYSIAIPDWTGELRFKNIEGEYFWYDIDKILELDKIFRTGFELGLPHLNKYLKKPDSYTPYLIEMTSSVKDF
ncbi:NUDIX domain-containing protein [Candidatus Dojkabacteria bacterium]|nr:NUDIX domain-containing protein [Candidatus Dojkabacteria bacterium]